MAFASQSELSMSARHRVSEGWMERAARRQQMHDQHLEARQQLLQRMRQLPSPVDRIKGLVAKLCSAGEANDILGMRSTLHEIDHLPLACVTADMLKQTKAGITVAKLRKHGDQDVAMAADAIVRRWKQEITDKEGIPSQGLPSPTPPPPSTPSRFTSGTKPSTASWRTLPPRPSLATAAGSSVVAAEQHAAEAPTSPAPAPKAPVRQGSSQERAHVQHPLPPQRLPCSLAVGSCASEAPCASEEPVASEGPSAYEASSASELPCASEAPCASEEPVPSQPSALPAEALPSLTAPLMAAPAAGAAKPMVAAETAMVAPQPPLALVALVDALAAAPRKRFAPLCGELLLGCPLCRGPPSLGDHGIAIVRRVPTPLDDNYDLRFLWRDPLDGSAVQVSGTPAQLRSTARRCWRRSGT